MRVRDLDIRPAVGNVLLPSLLGTLVAMGVFWLAMEWSGAEVRAVHFALPLALCLAVDAYRLVRFGTLAHGRVVAGAEGIEVARGPDVRRLRWASLRSVERGILPAPWLLLRRSDGPDLLVRGDGMKGGDWNALCLQVRKVVGHPGAFAAAGEAAPAPSPPEAAEEEPAGAFSYMALQAAAAAGVVGALAWGLTMFHTGYEIGWLALGIGALVGGAAALFRGGGTAMGVTCAAVALLSILGGKLVFVDRLVKREVHRHGEEFRAELTRGDYERERKAAEDYGEGVPPERRAAFLVSHDMVPQEDPAEVGAEALADFEKSLGPRLEAFRRAKPDFEAWRESHLGAFRQAVMAQVPYGQVFAKTLGPLDLLFGLLGIVAAFRFGSGKGTPKSVVGRRVSAGRGAGKPRVRLPPRKGTAPAGPGDASPHPEPPPPPPPDGAPPPGPPPSPGA